LNPIGDSTIRDRDEKQEVVHTERTAFAVRRNAKAFRSWVVGKAYLGAIVPRAGEPCKSRRRLNPDGW